MKITRLLSSLSSLLLIVLVVAMVITVAIGDNNVNKGEENVIKVDNNKKESVEGIRFVHDYLIPPPPSHVIYDNIKRISEKEKSNKEL